MLAVSASAHNQSQSPRVGRSLHAERRRALDPARIAKRALAAWRGAAVRLLLASWLGFSVCAYSQSPSATAATSQSADRRQSQPRSRVQPVTTTVVVHGEVKDDYLPDAVTVGTLDGATLKETPLSATGRSRANC